MERKCIIMNPNQRLVVMDKWEEIIHTAENSGMSIRPWCDANAIKASQYYYWHRQLVLAGRISGNAPRVARSQSDIPAVPVFAEVSLDGNLGHGDSGTGVLEEDLRRAQIMIERNHCKIFVGDGFSTSALEKVLEVIGNAS